MKIFLLVNPVISENLVNLEKPTSVLSGVKSFSRGLMKRVSCVQMSTIHVASKLEAYEKEETSGGYCGGVPPLPIPNREVKPTYADGTAMQCGRVGSRLLFKSKQSPEDSNIFGAFSFCSNPKFLSWSYYQCVNAHK